MVDDFDDPETKKGKAMMELDMTLLRIRDEKNDLEKEISNILSEMQTAFSGIHSLGVTTLNLDQELLMSWD